MTNRDLYDILVKCFALHHITDGEIMFEKNMKIAYLIDFYGDLLDDHTGEVLRAYYDDDLSLAEIAAEEGISRQGVRHLIKKGEEQLLFLEEKLGLAEKHIALKNTAKELFALAEAVKCKENGPSVEALIKGAEKCADLIMEEDK